MPSSPASQILPGHAGLVSVDGRNFPLDAVALEARAGGGIAQSTLTQRFRNPHPDPLEVVYTLPLPADGAVLAYDIEVGDKRIRGEVRRREDALQQYRDALFDGRLASLLEQERDDTFSQRLGSVPPGAEVRVALQILHPLKSVVPGDGGAPRWEYRFPTVTGVRYHGAEGRVPDRERIDPDRSGDGAIPTRVTFALELADGTAAELAAESPSHAIALEGARVVLGEASRLDRDLVVLWRACATAAGLAFVEGGGLSGDEGRYALLTVTPPGVPAASLPRDLTLLLDASGSMEGPPLAATRRIATALLRSLDAQDRFEVLVFSNKTRRLTPGLEPADERAVSAAVAAIGALTAGGGTEMRQAIVEALASARDGAQRQVVLVTDGQIGFEREIVHEVMRRSPGGCRVHVVGVGPAPNRSLTAAASRAGAGVEVLVSSGAEAEEAAARLVQATRQPVLTDVTVEGTAVAATAPAHPRDVLAGAPTWIAVRLAERGGTLRVRARLAGSSEPWVRSVEVPAIAGGGTSLPLGALYGREAVADLELRLAAEGGQYFEQEIEALGLRHRIATRRTSLVAVAETPSVDPRAPRRVEVLPVEIPEGLSAEGLGLGGMIFRQARLREGGVERRRAMAAEPVYEPALLGVTRLWKRLRKPRASVLRADGQRLVVEIVSPEDGFLLPVDMVFVERDGQRLEARVVAEESSPRGPHGKGRVVRLTLTLLGRAAAWHRGEHLALGWSTEDGDLHLPLVIPAEALTSR